jgi:2-hydroxychromene-2-carboxylate isomerase
MTAGAFPEVARLTVVLDIRHPFSYLALRPSFDLVEETGVEVEWLPIRAHTLVEPSAPSPEDDRGVRHRRFRAEMIAREIEVYADAQGLTIESPYRDGKADAVHLAWLWVLDVAPMRLPPFIEEVFRRYWASTLDPENLEDVLLLLDDPS